MKKVTKALAAIMLMTLVVLATGCNKENNGSDVRVTTYTPQDVTQTSARCGGDVIVTQGLSLNEIGVCWSTSSKPTVEDAHLSTANWSEPYVCTITGLEPGTLYHVRAYALRGLEYYYGEDKSFTTEENGGGGGGNSGGNGTFNGHEYVDLGLPSGTLWATCNVGADTPEGYGDYFAWGETQPKTTYNWFTYRYSHGDQLTKYCSKYYFGYNAFYDDLTTLLPEDDAATVNWGGNWRMPTLEEWQELLANTTNKWTSQGRLFTASNGSSLFLPAAGYRSDDGDGHYAGGIGYYWSSSLDTDRPYYAWYVSFNSGYARVGHDLRYDGGSVRAVREN